MHNSQVDEVFLPVLKRLWKIQVPGSNGAQQADAAGSQGPTPDTKADPLLGAGILRRFVARRHRSLEWQEK